MPVLGDVPLPEPAIHGARVSLSCVECHSSGDRGLRASDGQHRHRKNSASTSPGAAAPMHFPRSFSSCEPGAGMPEDPRRAAAARRVTGSGHGDTFPAGCTSCPSLVSSEQRAPALPQNANRAALLYLTPYRCI